MSHTLVATASIGNDIVFEVCALDEKKVFIT
jgi:hypothetical protein